MGKILPGRFMQSAFLLLIPVIFMFILTAQATAQDAPSLPADKVVQYNAYISQGDRYLEQGKYREAIAEYNRALLLNPGSDDAKRGIIKANQAIANRAAAPSAADIEAERLNFHLSKGTEYYEEAVQDYSMDKLAQAVAEWEQALQIDPENRLARSLIDSANRAKVDFLIEKGHDDYFAGNIKEAIVVWEEAKKLAPASKVLGDLIFEANQALHEREMDQLKKDFQIETNVIQEFSSKAGFLPEGASPDGIRRRDISLRPPLPQLRQFGEKEAIVKELSQPVAFEFECESLRGVLKFLTEITGINILVDQEIFEEFGEDEDCYGNKAERKDIFVTIHVSELPLESALNGMLRQHGLGFSIEKDFIYVSTPDVLRGSSFEQLETRFYHLKDTTRIALPKIEASGGQTTASLGGKALNIVGRQSVISGLREVQGSKVMEIESGYEAMSVPKLVEILRTFIPVVLDQSKQTGKRTIRVSEDKEFGGYETGDDPLRLFNSPRQLWADAAGREILSIIDFDPVTNTLIIRNTPTNLGMIEVFLDNLDKEPRQISVESKFITYSITEAKRVGIDFEFGGTEVAGDQTDTAGFDTDDISEGSQINTSLVTDIGETILGEAFDTRGGDIFFRFTKADGDFLQATINLLEELTSARVVSAPRLVTLNNKPAVIQDTLTQSFRSNIDFSTNIVTPEAGQTTTITDVTQEFTDVTSGITLSITPQIQYDNTIRLFILPNVSEVTDTQEFTIETASQDTTTINTITRPVISQQSLFSNIVVNDGDTIVVGGMISDRMLYQDTGLPFFKDIPLFGRLFENKTQFSDSQNLLIFITVNIMDPAGVAYTRLK